MRQIGTIRDKTDLQRLTDYLLTLGIHTHADEDHEQGFVLWGVEEDKIAEARAEVSLFQQNPHDPKYSAAARTARELRAAAERRERALRKNIIPVGQQWNRVASPPRVTWLLVAVSIAVALATSFAEPSAVVVPNRELAIEALSGKQSLLVQRLTIAQYVGVKNGRTVWIPLENRFSDVCRGEVWRLITPIFIHFAIYHLVFNMLGLLSLGKLLESRYGLWWMLIFVLVTAVFSNLAQYQYGGPKLSIGGPTFGGMSGVLYAQFGFAWLRGRYDPAAGFRLSPSSVFIMLLWLVVCMSGTVGAIANMAHFSGLAIGAAWGVFPTVLTRLRR